MKIYTIIGTASIWQILNKSNVLVASRLYDFGVTGIGNLKFKFKHTEYSYLLFLKTMATAMGTRADCIKPV